MARRKFGQSLAVLAAISAGSTAEAQPPDEVRWVRPADAGPHGTAPGARSRRVSTTAEGENQYVLVLREGDEVATALADFAREHHVVNAHFQAIGAVHDPEVGWYDKSRQAYKAMTRHEQMEVLTLSGDIALGTNGQPVVHTHVVLGADDGQAWGGHLLSAITSPTLEVYVTTFDVPVHKRSDAATGLQLLDPSQ